MLLSCPEHWAKVLLVLNDNEINSNDPLQVGDKHPALLKDEVEDDDNDATADDDDDDDDNDALQVGDKHPALLKDEVCSPGGSTIRLTLNSFKDGDDAYQ